MPLSSKGPQPDAGGRAPVTVVVGEEELLVERAVAAVLSGIRAAADGDAGADVHDVRGADLAAGELGLLTAPSLFGGDCVVVIRAAQDANATVAGEIGQLAAAMPAEVTMVVTHAGGAKGKALLAALGKAGASRIDCPSHQEVRRADGLPARGTGEVVAARRTTAGCGR